MDNRIPGESFFQFSPVGDHGSLQRSSSLQDRERRLVELFTERQKLAPFMQILPICNRLLNQEIMRASGLVPNCILDQEQIGDEYLYGPMVQQINGGLMNAETWNTMAAQEDRLLHKLGPIQPSSMDWHLVPNTPIIPVVKRVVRLDVPVDKYPNYNFVGAYWDRVEIL